MFNSFDRQGHKRLSAEITQELVALGARLGLDISASGGSIGSDNLVIKLTAKTNDTQAVEAKLRRELDYNGRLLGLNSGDYGAVFLSNNRRFKLTGVNPGRPKYPISAENLADGRSWKLGADVVRKIIAARPAQAATPTVPVMQTPQPQTTPPTNNLGVDFSDYSQF